MSERDTDYVVTLLRPILKDLHVQHLTSNPIVIKASDYRSLIIAGMSRCLIVARQTVFSEDTKGCLSFSFDRDHNIFLFIINVGNHLFVDDSSPLRILRKAIAIHEFVHCTSAMLLLSRLRTEPFIQRTERSMSKKVILTTSSEFNALLIALMKIGNNPKTELLTDEHFRIGIEDDFTGHYGDLYINFLLSYQLLYETIAAAQINNSAKANSFYDIIRIIHNDLVEKKALERDFVLGRIKTFLPRIFTDFQWK
jgi:hypothetical protein